jgi:hypothetical protein
MYIIWIASERTERMPTPGGPYSADDLAARARELLARQESELPARLVRDYLARVLREKPGRGRRKPYTDRVLNKLLCLLQVRDLAPRLALPDLGRVINSLPADQVARLAAGEDLAGVPDAERPDELMQHFRGTAEPVPDSAAAPAPESRAGAAGRSGTGAGVAGSGAEPAAAERTTPIREAPLEPLDELFDLLKKDRRSASRPVRPVDASAAPPSKAEPEAVARDSGAASSSPAPGPAAEPGDSGAAWTVVPTRRGVRLEVAAELSIAQQRQLEMIAELIHEIVTGSG